MKKRHPAAVREWAIQQIMLPIGRSMSEVARELGVTTEALRLWKKQFLSQLNLDDEAKPSPPGWSNAKHAPAPEILVGGGQSRQTRYTAAFREWAIQQMMPPVNRPVVVLARETGVTPATLRTWQDAARAEGKIMARSNKPGERWSSSDKFRMVLQAAPLSEVERSAYCRRQGIYPEQLQQWQRACELANAAAADPVAPAAAAARAQHQRIKQLERDLAEARALLVLRKKAEAIWGKDAEE